MDITDSTLNQSEIDRLEGHRKLEKLGLNIPLRKTKRLAKIDKKLENKTNSKKNFIEDKENEELSGNSIQDNNDKFQYLDEASTSHNLSKASALIPEPFDGKSPAAKAKYIKTYFDEKGPVIDIDLKLFFELNEVEINLDYLNTISTEIDNASRKEKLFFEQKMIVALSMIDFSDF